MTNEQAINLITRISYSQHDAEKREALEMAVRALFSQQIVNDSQGLVNDCISRKMAIDEVKRLHDVAWANWKETRISANTMIDALKDLPSAQPEVLDCGSGELVKDSQRLVEASSNDIISRQQAIEAFEPEHHTDWYTPTIIKTLEELPSAQPERLTDDDFETIRIHLNAYKEKLCNQQRWEEAEEYQRIIDRFMAFASARKDLRELPSAQPDLDEWCTDCKEYDDKRHCCPRWNRVIRQALKDAQPERKKGKWISEVKGKKAIIDEYGNVTCSAHCSECGDWLTGSDEYACRGRFCPNCGADMRGESE